MEKTWRWFGRTDRITLDALRQIGIQGIVTALHHIPNGQIWSLEEIENLKSFIENSGLRWSVVESLPVSEAIKYGGDDRDILIDNYITSLENLGRAGVKTVCYNFMPVIDWIRTDLRHPLPDGTNTLYFDIVRFAYFDINILKRPNASKDYSPEVLEKVERLSHTITTVEKNNLIDTIIVKTQGFINGNIKEGDNAPVSLFRKLLSKYDGISREQLRSNMKYFLERIMPVCNRYGIKMCVHPDDPPRAVLGLPRIVTDAEDLQWIIDAVDDPHNGITFCAGSLSSGSQNDVPALARRFAHRTHFIHLRSTDILSNGNFIEASHLEGRGHLIQLVRIFEKQNPELPMRVDHGKLMLDDMDKGYNPGYSFHGRMLALGQMEGVIAVVKDEIKNKLI
ncbi:mannonate dehydratase [Alistipes senegalensis]|uniref:mannonate dehydratase n=1 Tax=Alistipes senegalensis TaxID=1288121 RepID=UPI0018AAA8DF|nr:mannonate dehydratase [Alistipes senegalensis]